MATTAILQPQDPLLRSNRFRRNPNPSSCPNRRRKRNPSGSPVPAKGHVIGQVKIMKRGEVLSRIDDDLALSSTDRLGPEPEMVRRQIRVPDRKIYAGSAVFLPSPPPSSLPLPAFFDKVRNEAATSDLRRILGLGDDSM